MSELERRLEDLGRGILEADRPVSLLEIGFAPRGMSTGPGVALLGDEEVVALGPQMGSSRRWQVFLAACVVIFLAFLPFMLTDSPGNVTASARVVIGDRTRSTSFPSGSSTFVVGGRWFEMDGVYYGCARCDLGEWLRSADGIEWTEITARTSALPPVTDALRIAFYDLEDSLYVTSREASSEMRVLQWAEDGWVEVPVTLPTPPEGINLIAHTDHGFIPPFIGRPTTVVLRDGSPLTVGNPGRSSGMVEMGGLIYGLSHDEGSGYRLWSSVDGTSWAAIDLPSSVAGHPEWAFLSGGHDRLMLTIGGEGDHDATRAVFTSTDATTWDQLDLPVDFGHPVIPEATDFGWMMMSPGEPYDSGLWNPEPITVLLSVDGENWVDESDRFYRGTGVVGAPAFPLVYEAGLFARRSVRLPSDEETHVWRVTDDPTRR
jgi:hypothetical protein